MKNQTSPDVQEHENPDTDDMEKSTMALPVVITLGVALISGTWLLSNTVYNNRVNALQETHNYRLENIIGRLKNHETDIVVGIRERATIMQNIENFGNLLTEVRDDVKVLIKNNHD